MKYNPTTRIRIIGYTAFYVATLLVANATPLFASAQDAVVEQTNPTAIVSETIPPEPSYVYNETTGRWENGTYSWDPSTNTTTPLNPTGYSYNPTTGRWETAEWIYDASTNAYVPPAPKTEITPSRESPAYDIDESKTPSTTPTIEPEQGPSDSLNIQSNLPEATTHSVAPVDTNFFDGFYDAEISVSVASSAISGNALVVNNTIGGSASTGDAYVDATIVNVLQSSWGMGTNTVPVVHTLTLQGNHVGDIVLDPGFSQMSSMYTPQLTVTNYSQDTSIANDIDLLAMSGNATVSNNTEAGNALSGDAYALANLMNIVQSSITSQQSFIAILNILGDLEGDVLLPPDLQKQLASNTHETYAIPLDDYQLQTSNNTSITTVVDAGAVSGDANVIGNTEAGSATSGSADTIVTVYNLTGQTIIAENAVLVFVQVLGEWIGFITNAPTGSTTAMLGCCEPTSGLQQSLPAEMNLSQNTSILNNVRARAETGDATVTNNTVGGNASSGDALALVNVMNITQSTISLRGWFAVMFINVMGNWHGSFGTDTIYGGLSSLLATGGDTYSTSNPSSPYSLPDAQPQTNQKDTVHRSVVLGTSISRSRTDINNKEEAKVAVSTDTAVLSASQNENAESLANTGSSNGRGNILVAILILTTFIVVASRMASKFQE